MQEAATVLFSGEEGVGTITLNRPEVMNSLNGQMVSRLTKVLKVAKEDAAIKTIVLTGAGRAFCAGGDLGYLASLADPVSAKAFIASVGQLVSLIMEMDKPVVAMVNGVAAGAGFNLALACDLVFCSQSARFAQSFAKVGLIPDCGGLYLLPRIVGMHKAKELMFTADIINAQAALDLGLVNRVLPEETLREETYQFAERMANSAPIALGIIKKMINRSDTLDLGATLEMEANLQALCMQTEDYKEGVQAFREKRAAIFKGK